MYAEKEIGAVLITEDDIISKINELGAIISSDYMGKNPLIVSVLKGSFIFMADLVRAIKVPCTIDFMSISSYGSGTGSGEVKILKDLDSKLEGRHVIVVEDILDSGKTLSFILDIFRARGAESIEICTFLNKPSRRVVDLDVKYNGFDVPDEFVVGYGLDYAENWRNLPYVGVLHPDIYS